ncbi:MAG: hypothetical protein ACTJG4_07645 [Vreelandella alkaliphila]|uniref:hypothetical protein n=1 Tax=Vreelandella alkaliphila TaxID=272774 RepID=UPI003F9BD0A9
MKSSRIIKDCNKDLTSHELVVTYDSSGKPYSKYMDDKWIFLEHDYTLNLNRVSGEFKETLKKVVYQRTQEASLKSFKSAVKNYCDGAVIFEKIIKECGGSDYKFLEDDKSYRLFLETASSKKLKTKSWKNYFIFIVMLNTKGYIKRDFGNIDLLARKLSENSEQSKQAMAMPEEISSYYFNSAIKTIEKYHPFRKKISCLYDIYLNQFYYYKNKGYHHVTCRTKALKKAHEHKLYDIELDLNGKWLSWIRGACPPVSG